RRRGEADARSRGLRRAARDATSLDPIRTRAARDGRRDAGHRAARIRAVKSASRDSFRALLSLLGEISDEWIGPERRVESAERDALAHEALAAVLWGALEFYLTEDFDKPRFTPIVTPFRKWSDNPDARYYFAAIRGGATYRIRGQRGSEVYSNFTVHR